MKSFHIMSPANGKAFSTGSVIESTGTHSLDPASLMWVVLQDVFGHYYLQNPPVRLNSNGDWHAKNIHLGHDITEIIFVRVTADGNEFFLKKVNNNDWGAFDEFPPETENLGNISIKVN